MRKKGLAYFTSIALAMTMLPHQSFAQEKAEIGQLNEVVPISRTTASQLETNAYVGEGYVIEFRVLSQWRDAFIGEIILTNISETTLENWMLQLDLPHEITSIWNAQIMTHEKEQYILKNTGWNQDIAPGESISIGFNASVDEKVMKPKNYKLLGVKKEVTGCEIDFKVLNKWDEGFNGQISITNNTEENIEDWILSFDFAQNIQQFWTADIVAHEGNRYIIKNRGHNANIAPGQTIVLGFSSNVGNIMCDPTHYLLEQMGQVPKEQDEIDYEQDTDGDELVDCYEEILGTDSQNIDSDRDGLPDGYEVFTLGTDPTVQDTDENGIMDGDEDIDQDGLTNIKEYALGTAPKDMDTDGDNLIDGKEVCEYRTDPLLNDTDGEGLSDGDEIKLRFNPLLKDTDANGVCDAKEKVDQVFNREIVNSEQPEVKSISIDLSCAGVIDKVVSVNDMYGKDILSSNVIGLVGMPIQIASKEAVEKAVITFEYDENMLKDTREEDLAMMWYDEVHDVYQILDRESVINTQNNTVTYVANHLGVYLLVDRQKWYTAWENEIDYAAVDTKASRSMYMQRENDLEADAIDTQLVDTDGDGLTDVMEIEGVRIQNGEVITTDPFKADTDGDGLLDSEELGDVDDRKIASYSQRTRAVATYANSSSNPNAVDSDYDGINDSVDASPSNNNFSGILHTDFADSKVSYTMDYREFFKANTNYSPKIGTISSLYSSVVYDNNTYAGMDIAPFMRANGLTEIAQYDLATTYNDADVSEAYIGHRKVTYNGEDREIIAIVVRGTNGTIEEWSSNFDIGTTKNKSSYSDWSVSSNHKGFDIAATRILRCLTEYESNHNIDKSAKSVYWVMGHSRGAGIANIVGARLVNQSKYVYTYTFAAPNTTTAQNASNYAGIYNILNKDDFVPYLPMADWGFTHYGKSAVISIADYYETEWESLTGCKNRFGVVDYNIDAIGMEDTIEELSNIVNNRNECYAYTCKCHGDGSLDKISMTNYGMSKTSRENAIKKIPSVALPYCKITRYSGGLVSGWDFKVCQQPEYFMQVLAAYMAGDINEVRFAVELNIADRYEAAKSAIISSGLGGLEHPHYPESYYLLATHVTNSSF